VSSAADAKSRRSTTLVSLVEPLSKAPAPRAASAPRSVNSFPVATLAERRGFASFKNSHALLLYSVSQTFCRVRLVLHVTPLALTALRENSR
jgi:hypothetical protein